MKKKSPYIWNYILAVLLFSCQTANKNMIDLNKTAGTITQKFSDMADNLQAIPLETNDSCLLSEYIRVWAGNKYIVTVDQEAMHLFDRNGKHISRLASRGKGPGEFSTMPPFTVDEAKECLYYCDWRQKTSLRMIDLKNGKNIEKISDISHKINSILTTENHNLLCCPAFYEQSQYAFFTYSENGEELSHIIADTIEPDAMKGVTPIYLSKTGNRISYWNPQTENLFFQIEDTVKIPKLYIKFENPLNSRKKQGNVMEIYAETLNELFVSVEKLEISENELFRFTSPVRGEPVLQYRIGKNDGTVHLIDRFYNDLLGEYSPSLYKFTTNGNHIFIQKKALQIKQFAEKQLREGKELTPELKKLNARLKEDDNPVIIIGTLKKTI